MQLCSKKEVSVRGGLESDRKQMLLEKKKTFLANGCYKLHAETERTDG